MMITSRFPRRVSSERSGDEICEISFVIEALEPGMRTFQAEGLTLGGRVERRMVYRFKGLIAQ